MDCIKHLIKCRCVISQFKTQPNPPNHQFVVFSVFDENDVLVQKFVQCNNCGVVHRVIDVCKSEIVEREFLSSSVSIDEIKMGIPEQLLAVLETNQVDLATYEHVRWILENQKWGEIVILSSEMIDGTKQGKFLRMFGERLFKIESFTRDEIIK